MNGILSQLVDMDYYTKDELYQLEVKSKGCLLNVTIEFLNQLRYKVSFYNIKRFEQDLTDGMFENYFFEENIIFLKDVTLENIIKVISIFNEKKMYRRLINESTGDENYN
jgi:hypothetical protein